MKHQVSFLAFGSFLVGQALIHSLMMWVQNVDFLVLFVDDTILAELLMGHPMKSKNSYVLSVRTANFGNDSEKSYKRTNTALNLSLC